MMSVIEEETDEFEDEDEKVCGEDILLPLINTYTVQFHRRRRKSRKL